ncbi:MAG: hypothetical protein L3J07_01550 [Candidatus Magasanikbacteria bacterium]|nr:hypothetical protein [Candidatus Magasanikbacteria bacterium]
MDQQLLDDKGFVALISVLTLGAVSLSIVLTMLFLGTDYLRTDADTLKFSQAKYAAEICAEEALQRINESELYSGTDTIFLDDGQCTMEIIITTSTATTQGDFNNVDISGLTYTGGGDDIEGITLQNTSTTADITITGMTVSWTGGDPGNKIKKIRIDGDKIWDKKKTSGTFLDVTDYILLSGGSQLDLKLEFDKQIQGGTVTVIFTMSDGSTTTSEVTGGGTISNDQNREIKTTGTVGNSTRKIEIIIDQITPNINLVSWDEVADF